MPIYVYFRSTRGSLVGEVLLDAESAVLDDVHVNSVDSLLTWSRSAGTEKSRVYRAGFGPVDLTVDGGQYAAPSPAMLILDLAQPPEANNALLSFEGIGLPATKPDVIFSVLSSNKVVLPITGINNPRSTKLQINVRNGTFGGSFSITEPNLFTTNGASQELTRKVTFTGLLIPGLDDNNSYGHGYFVMPQMPTQVGESLGATPILGGEVRIQQNEP
jgi:hypothetical protein